MNFYKIKKDYLDHLRQYDMKVPQHVESGKEKLYVGIVMNTKDYNYFVPLSSFDRPQQTNFVLQKNNNRRLGSLRLSFMIPVDKTDDSGLEKIDMNALEDVKYRRLLEQELKLCRQNKKKIIDRAKRVYEMGNDPDHPRYKDCIQFKALEGRTSAYQFEKTQAHINQRKKNKRKNIEL